MLQFVSNNLHIPLASDKVDFSKLVTWKNVAAFWIDKNRCATMTCRSIVVRLCRVCYKRFFVFPKKDIPIVRTATRPHYCPGGEARKILHTTDRHYTINLTPPLDCMSPLRIILTTG